VTADVFVGAGMCAHELLCVLLWECTRACDVQCVFPLGKRGPVLQMAFSGSHSCDRRREMQRQEGSDNLRITASLSPVCGPCPVWGSAFLSSRAPRLHSGSFHNINWMHIGEIWDPFIYPLFIHFHYCGNDSNDLNDINISLKPCFSPPVKIKRGSPEVESPEV
jgi:hypothetical protein